MRAGDYPPRKNVRFVHTGRGPQEECCSGLVPTLLTTGQGNALTSAFRKRDGDVAVSPRLRVRKLALLVLRRGSDYG